LEEKHMSIRKEALKQLQQAGIEISEKVNLSEFSYLKTGGEAELVVFPRDHEQLQNGIKILNELGILYRTVGATSNLIFLDDKQYTCLLCTNRMTDWSFDLKERLLIAESGVMLPELSRIALYQSIVGFEGFEGIPGTIGGAVFMNAGAYGNEIKKVLLKVEVVCPDGTSRTYSVDQLGLQYRNSIFRHEKNSEIISRCYFKAPAGDQKAIYKKMEFLHSKRHKYQEYMYPNLGSLFSGSVYRALGTRDPVYKMISSAYYLFCYKWKLFRRESPINRKWINDITVSRFGIRFDKQPFSDKTMN
jgi:UDP-N-acetylmuramate dehydrogenase